MIKVTRLGFNGISQDNYGAPYDGPEKDLEFALSKMEQGGHIILSVSVARSSRWSERYEAFVVSRISGKDVTV